MKRLKVYIAGKLNADAIGYIQNMHRMITTAREIRRLGFSVYVPCNDILEGLVDGHFDYADYFDNSQPWLLCADAVFLTPEWETSEGTKKEKALAEANNIPVFEDKTQLMYYAQIKGF
jgi:hypothetical protein